jgi:uncharacterized protein YgbK (DUF1537 family)
MQVPKAFVISDDVTGSNAIAIGFSKHQARAVTIFDQTKIKYLNEYDSVIFSSNTRGSTPVVAYDKVKEILGTLNIEKYSLLSKRIDSTMRGNIGSEMKAFFDVLGSSVLALVVPSSPELGRVVDQGIMSVQGVQLHKTAAALDVVSPIHTSNVVSLIQQQIKDMPIHHISSDDLLLGQHALIKRLFQLAGEGYRIIVFDGKSNQEIELIARAALGSRLHFFAVDPGPFSIELMKLQSAAKVISVVGTTNPVARKQLEILLGKSYVYGIEVSINAFVKNEETKNQEIHRCIQEILERQDTNSVFCLYSEGVYSEKRLDLHKISVQRAIPVEELHEIINASFAEIAYQVNTTDFRFSRFFTCGGDITLALSKRFDAYGFLPLTEVIPFAVFGNLLCNTQHQISIVTKGGMVGNEDAMSVCVEYLSAIREKRSNDV